MNIGDIVVVDKKELAVIYNKLSDGSYDLFTETGGSWHRDDEENMLPLVEYKDYCFYLGNAPFSVRVEYYDQLVEINMMSATHDTYDLCRAILKIVKANLPAEGDKFYYITFDEANQKWEIKVAIFNYDMFGFWKQKNFYDDDKDARSTLRTMGVKF